VSQKPQGEITRGTTNPNRLRRVDRWLAWSCAQVLRDAADPLVVDLGYGATPITTVELRDRLAHVRQDLRVTGLEIDPERVAAARDVADPPRLSFARGGFELAGLRPVIVRAFNVLRQYDESAVLAAWETMTSRLAPGGWLIEGTCDELGRLCAWAALPTTTQRTASAASRAASPARNTGGTVAASATGSPGGPGPQTLTLAAKLSTLDSPATFAERLPKALIHRNVPGEPIFELLATFTEAWRQAAPMGVFGPRQRWIDAVRRLHESGVPVLYQPTRWRLGEVTFPWPG
jgi:hypothetical protein